MKIYSEKTGLIDLTDPGPMMNDLVRVTLRWETTPINARRRPVSALGQGEKK